MSKDNKQEKQVQILDKCLDKSFIVYYIDDIPYVQRLKIKQEMVRYMNTQLDTKIGNF